MGGGERLGVIREAVDQHVLPLVVIKRVEDRRVRRVVEDGGVEDGVLYRDFSRRGVFDDIERYGAPDEVFGVQLCVDEVSERVGDESPVSALPLDPFDRLDRVGVVAYDDVRSAVGDFVSSPQALSGVKSAQYVDTDIQFSCFSRIKRQNHKYYYTEHLFVCQGF